MKKHIQDGNQGTLFSDDELDRLQEEIKANYQTEYEKARYVPEAVEDDELIFPERVELPTKHYVMQNTLFSDQEIEELQKQVEKEKAEKLQRDILEARKHIKPPRFAHPKNDNEWLFNFQYDFIVNGSQTSYGRLFELSYQVTKRLIRKWLASMGGKVYWDEITQDEKTMDAIVYVLRRYSTIVGWYCSTNFITVLNDGVRHVTNYQTKIQKNTIYCEDVNVAVIQDKKTTMGKKTDM